MSDSLLLDHPRLRCIEEKLNGGEIDAAQHLVAGLGEESGLGVITDYFATRLLLHRGRIDEREAMRRLRLVVRTEPKLTEAVQLLRELEARCAGAMDPTASAPGADAPPVGIGHGEPMADWSDECSIANESPDLAANTAPGDEPDSGRGFHHASPQLPSDSPNVDSALSEPAQRVCEAVTLPAPPDAQVERAHLARGVRARIVGARDGEQTELTGGRYAAPPPKADVLRSQPPETGVVDGGDSSSAERSRATPAGLAGSAERDHSPPPPATAAGLPTVFELAHWLDMGEFARVLDATELERGELGAEYVLLRVRALLGAGREQAALDRLMFMLSAPLVEPELRAGGAKLLVESGWHDAAFQQSSRAFAESPAAPAVRVTHAWAALRLARRRNPVALAHTASIALSGLQTRDAPQPALLLALRACAEAHVGDAARAVRLAQRALRLEPQCTDAQVAVALASARLRRMHDARQAWRRLFAVAPLEADALRAPLAKLGVQLSDTPPPADGEGAHASIESIWEPQEVALLGGQVHDVIAAFESNCRARLTRLAESEGEPSFPEIAGVAAAMLTEAPVWQHFAPYDFSLYSATRVEAALRVLYAEGAGSRDDADDFPVLAVVASYLGETLCHAHDARWEGSLLCVDQVAVVAEQQRWLPFRLVEGCMHRGTPLELDPQQQARASHPGSEAWSRNVPNPTSPPCPWWPDPWPPVARMKRLGRELSRSIVSRYCEQYAGSPLDGSIASLDALDCYVSLVAPPALRSDATAPWTIRLALLAGAYLGEVLREALGGEWLEPRTTALEPDSYRFRLSRGVIVTPVSLVLERLIGARTTSIRHYANQLVC